ELTKIRKERGYNYFDLIEICPEKLENYEKVKNFYREHIHADEANSSVGWRVVGHFIADCPKRNGHKKGTSGGIHDSGKHDSSSFNKGKPKTRFFRKALKDYRRENKKSDKAFFAEMEKSYSKRSTSSSSSSSSSDEEIVIRKGKDKDDPASLCFMAFGDKPKSRSHQRRRSRKSFCSMALGDKEEKSSSDDSDSDDNEKMHIEFEMSLMGELKYFLGLQIKQTKDDTFIHQDDPDGHLWGLDKDESSVKSSPRASHRQAVKRIFRY
ncbi:hypothetical protein GUJ93_ZPchr0013g37941, partial [Zizania palustris]